MPPVSIQKVRPGEEPEPTVFTEVERMFEQVRNRAFTLFRDRGYEPGSALEDWLRAEREVLNMPAAELVESDKEFRLRVAVPGLDASHLKVTALPRSLVVEGEETTSKEKTGDRLVFQEFSSRRFFRKVDLPHDIDPEKAKAGLDKGVLEI